MRSEQSGVLVNATMDIAGQQHPDELPPVRGKAPAQTGNYLGTSDGDQRPLDVYMSTLRKGQTIPEPQTTIALNTI